MTKSTRITITPEELLQAKRAVVVYSEMSRVTVELTGRDEPLQLKADRRALIKLLRKLEAIVEP